MRRPLPSFRMPCLACFRAPGLALVAAAAALLPAAPARAQGVRMFDDAPSLEQLRSIMIPESTGSAARSIVLAPQTPASGPRLVQMAVAHIATPAALPALRSPQTDAAPPPLQPVAAKASVSAVPSAPALAVSASADSGKPESAPHEAAGAVGFRINFALDSDAIPPSARSFIDRIGELLRQETKLKLRIEGHTDAIGSSEYNLDLSWRRGQAVAAYLVAQQGIAADRLQIVGMGKTAPLLDDPYDPRNRRVQFARID
jgi:outer membrane protein OmpA-like peptidoglycan-associated protein